jgi:tRNA dimethylallyltransferase
MMSQEILAIIGPTASGKTEMALRLAREQPTEIISVDSRQVYRHLSVGTAKPQGHWTPETKKSPALYLVEDIPYHLVDFWDPLQRFSAAAFVHEATQKISQIRARGKTPLLVGGTGLYYKALTEGLAPLPPADEKVRERLRQQAEKNGRSQLHRELAHRDPKAAAKIPANNIHRVIRALEVYELTGKPISQWHEEQLAPRDKITLRFLGIDWPREELHRRIAERSERMIHQGFIQETQDLLNKGYPENSPALSGLGYPRMIAHLKGELTKEDLLTYLIQDTRQYAKRQMTWFRHQLPVTWQPSLESWKK